MIKKNDNRIINLLRDFQTSLDNRPDMDTMYKEVSMMNFKIRPVQGDIALLDLKNSQLVELLWKLGRLDEFYQQEYGRLNFKQREVFGRFFDNLHGQFQKQLSRLNLKTEQVTGGTPVFEMEIFREKTEGKKIN